MADWDHGYISDVSYTAGFHRETAPAWIATVATCLNSVAPDISSPFRYADLGCGNGVTALVVAATMPQADVWAFDFNPVHIHSARDIARRAGLANIHFEEASFEDLACRPPGALPMFDYIAAHGVISWISHENRRHVFDVIGQRLAPGGIAYISYNLATGWASLRPVHRLMRLLAEASPERSDLALTGVFDTIDRMKSVGAEGLLGRPALDARLSGIREADPRYAAHELLNRDWHPLMFPEVASAMAENKCDYIGSATMANNLLGYTVPETLREMFSQTRDPKLREVLRDVASADAFRRDLYQRGPSRMSATEWRARFGAIKLVRTFAPVPDPLVLLSPFGRFTPHQDRFRCITRALEAGPMTVDQIRRLDPLSDCPDRALLEIFALLISAGYLSPMLDQSPDEPAIAAAARLNGVHAELFEQGHNRPYLAYPALGGAWQAHEVEILALDSLRTNEAAEEQSLTDAVVNRLRRGGLELRRSGALVTDPAGIRETVNERVKTMLQDQLPTMRRLGAQGIVRTAPGAP